MFRIVLLLLIAQFILNDVGHGTKDTVVATALLQHHSKPTNTSTPEPKYQMVRNTVYKYMSFI